MNAAVVVTVAVAIVSGGWTSGLAIFVWAYTKPLRIAQTQQSEGQTEESAVSQIKQVADARFDEIRLLREQNAMLTQQSAAQKVDFERRIESLETKVDELEARNSSLRRRLDKYEQAGPHE